MLQLIATYCNLLQPWILPPAWVATGGKNDFAAVGKMISIGKGATREVEDR